MQTEQQEQERKEASQKNRALGVFLMFFGMVVVAALFFTSTAAGKVTNLISGLLLFGTGTLIFLLGSPPQETP